MGSTYGTTTNQIHVDHHAMWIDPIDPDRIIVGNDGGVAISYDKGGNWSYLNQAGALGQFYDISVNMDTPYRVCGGLQDNGTWCGPSRLPGGQITKYHWATISGGDGFVTAQDPDSIRTSFGPSLRAATWGAPTWPRGSGPAFQKPDWTDFWTPKQDTIVLLMEEGADEDDPRIQRLRSGGTPPTRPTAVMRWNWNTPFLQSTHDRSWFLHGRAIVF